METISLVGAAVLVVFLLNVVIKVFKVWRFRSTINKIPGPKSPPLIGISLAAIKINIEDRLPWFMKLCYQFKDGILRTWVGNQATVHIRKPRHMEVVLPSTTLITKSLIYKYIELWLGKGLVTSTGQKWFHDRKMITPSFHFGVLEEFAEVMKEKAEILNECLEKEIAANPGTPVDIFAFAVRCTMDVICETAMGMNLNCQREVDNAYGQALHRFSVLTLHRIFRPWLKWDWLFYRTAEGKELQAAVEVMHHYSTKVIRRKQEERRNKKNESLNDMNEDQIGRRKRKAFLDLLLDASENEEQPLSEVELREHVDTFMFAGHDTTAAAIGWAMFLIGHHPEVQDKISQELDEVLGSSLDPISTKDLAKLKYLEMVMKETLRLYPSAPQVSRTVTEDFELDGYKIPKDTTLSIGLFLLHRDPEIWPEPDKFDPERFSPENSKGRHPYAYVPFSAGPRNCIGQKFAMLEMKIVLSTVLRKWKVKSARSISDMKMVSAFILRPHNGIPVYLTQK